MYNIAYTVANKLYIIPNHNGDAGDFNDSSVHWPMTLYDLTLRHLIEKILFI